MDYFLADQLILPALFASGASAWTTHRATSHLRTLLWLVPQFVRTGVELTQQTDGNSLVRILPGGDHFTVAANGKASDIYEDAETPAF